MFLSHGCYQELAAAGFLHRSSAVDAAGYSWVLTKEAVDGLICCRELHSPTAVASVRNDDIPLLARSSFELISMLHDRGWSWRKFPSSRAAKERLSYQLGGELVWFTSGVTALPCYLACLLDAERLGQLGLLPILHSATKQYYIDMFSGKQPTPGKSAPAIVMDVEMDDEVPSQAPVRSSPLAGAEDPINGSDLEIEVELAAILREDEVGTPVGDEFGNHSERPPLAMAMVAPDPDASASAGSSGVLPPGDTLLVDAPPAGNRHPAQPSRDMQLSRFHWGAFRFTPKQEERSTGTVYAWEAGCPFHRKNARTDCKKTVSFRQLSESEAVILALKGWCNEALSVDRQWKHVGLPAIRGCHPPERLLDAAMISERPFERPSTDEELDRQEAAGGLPPRAKARSKAKAKTAVGKAQADARGQSSHSHREGANAQSLPAPAAQPEVPSALLDEVGPDGSDSSEESSDSDSSDSSPSQEEGPSSGDDNN